MISFICPSCKGKCSVGDEFAGRKMKCPKCRTRIRHHKDGQIELLSVGEPAPPAAAPPGTPAPAAPAAAAWSSMGPTAAPPPAPPPPPPVAPVPPPAAASTEAAKKDSTVAVAVVPELVGKLVSQSESKQNTIVIAGVIGFLAVALSAIGVVMGIMILTVAPIAVALAAAFVWLTLRAKKQKALAIRAEKQKIVKEAAETAKKDEGKTEALPKV